MAPVVSATSRPSIVGDPFVSSSTRSSGTAESGSSFAGSSFGGVAVLTEDDTKSAVSRPQIMPPWIVGIAVALMLAIGAGYVFTG